MKNLYLFLPCGTTGALTWSISGGTLTISGNGAMPDYNPSGSPWYSRRSSISSAVIDGGVTSIGGFAFDGCLRLTSITIPEGVTTIGEYAFWGCSGLTAITIPEGVTSIGYSAFYGCWGLTSITIPEGVTTIGEYAFWGCSGLTAITIPEGVASIGYGTFDGCSGLTAIAIPEGVASIGRDAFSRCSGLTSVTIPEGVTSIRRNAFSGCSGLTQITNMTTMPQVITDDTFSGMDKPNCTLKVPEGTEELYLAAPGWKDFFIETIIPVSHIEPDMTTRTLPVGDTETLISTVLPTNATITVTTDDGGKTASCTVTVKAIPVVGIALSEEVLALMVGEEETLTATVAQDNATDKSVAWSTTAASVATVDAATGLITAVAPGEATITVTTVDGSKTASCVVTVTQPVTSIALSEATLALRAGEEETLTATIAPDKASDKSVA